MVSLLLPAFLAFAVVSQLVSSYKVCNPLGSATFRRHALTPPASTPSPSATTTAAATATADALNRTKVSIKSSGTKKRKKKTEEEGGGQFSLKHLDERTGFSALAFQNNNKSAKL